jgi:hypothetical protein
VVEGTALEMRRGGNPTVGSNPTLSDMAKQFASGTAHKLPADLRKALAGAPKALAAWEDITPLARNEWICWVEAVKTPEVRTRHIKRTVTELQQGKRRPCCWIGCIHRSDKKLSPSQKFILGKRSKPAE